MRFGGPSQFAGTERFQVKRIVGKGAMGVVYEAFDRERGATIAIKTLPWASAANLYRFKREFRALADIEHPNLISLGELVEDQGQWFFTMDFVDGVDFLEYVRNQQAPDEPTNDFGQETTVPMAGLGSHPHLPCDEARLRSAASQLAIAIGALHQAGKVHRDIKPSNILVTSEGRVVLLDFGLITNVEHDANTSTQAQIVGTAAYMAPEQAVTGAVGPAADWYSFGVLLYEALTSSLPHSGGNALELMMKKQRYAPPPPRARLPGVPPDLDDLCVALLAHDPAERPGAREIMGRLGIDRSQPGGSAPVLESAPSSMLTAASLFLGREEELEMLRRAYETTQRGGTEIVLIEGESGLGKTALAARFLDEVTVRDRRAVVLAGRCHERESVPYKALDGVVDALSRYLRTLRDDEVAALLPRHAGLLPRLFPVLGRVEQISIAPRPQTELNDAHTLRERAFAALRELLFRSAERRPLIVWIDNLQWTDADSLVALRALIRSDDAPCLLLILSVRDLHSEHEQDDHGDHDLATFLHRLEPTRIRLAPLSEETSAELARRLMVKFGNHDQAAHIAREAKGHPLYVAELVRHVSRETADTPTRLRLEDAIAARIAELPDISRSILELVAVAGAPLASSIVEAAAKAEASDFRRQVATLRVAQFVSSHGVRNEDLLEPYHDYVRRAVLSSMDDNRRRERHARLAVALMTSPVAQRPELVLLHLEGAGQQEQAAEYAEEAAKRAEKTLSFDLARRLYETALRFGNYSHDRRQALTVAHAEATANAGRRAEAAQIYLEAAKAASAADALDLRRRAAESFLVCGHLDEGVEILREVLADFGVRTPMTRGQALRALALGRARLWLRGLGFTERNEAQIAPEDLRRIDACDTAARALVMSDSLLGMVFQTAHLRLALRAGEPQRATMALALETGMIACRGRSGRKKSRRLGQRCLALADRGDSDLLRTYAWWGIGFGHYQAGELVAALESWDRMQAILERMPGMHYERETVNLARTWADYYAGNWRNLARVVPRLLQAARDRGDLYSATNFSTGLPNAAWLLRGQPDRARRLAREQLERWSRHGFHLQHYWETFGFAQAGIYALDPTAWDLVDHRWRALLRSQLLRISMLYIEAFDLRGRCALNRAASLEDRDPARRISLREAQRCARKLRHRRLPMADALGDLLEAGVAALEGLTETSLGLLHDCLVRFDRLGMAGHAAAARWRMAELLGASEGEAMRAGARSWMESQDVAEPERMVQLLAPRAAPPV